MLDDLPVLDRLVDEESSGATVKLSASLSRESSFGLFLNWVRCTTVGLELSRAIESFLAVLGAICGIVEGLMPLGVWLLESDSTTEEPEATDQFTQQANALLSTEFINLPLLVKERKARINFEPLRRTLEGRNSVSGDGIGVLRSCTVWTFACCLSRGAPSSYIVKPRGLPALFFAHSILRNDTTCRLSTIRMRKMRVFQSCGN